MCENNAVIMTYNQREDNKPVSSPYLLRELVWGTVDQTSFKLLVASSFSVFFMAFSIALLTCHQRLLFADKGC